MTKNEITELAAEAADWKRRGDAAENRDPRADAVLIGNQLLAERLLRESGESAMSDEEIRGWQRQCLRDYENGGDDFLLDALWMRAALEAEAVLRSYPQEGEGTRR